MSNSVIVIGAGAAGLAAANKLKNEGVQDVKILEARDYIGGRVHTIHPSSEQLKHLSIDVGASWIHGIKGEDGDSFNPIMDLVEKYGIEYLKTHFNDSNFKETRKGSAIYDLISHEKLTEEKVKKLIKLAEAFESNVAEVARDTKDSDQISINDVFEAFCQQQKINKDSKKYRRLLQLVLVMFDLEYGLDLDKLSIHAADPYDHSKIAGDNVIFPNGFSQVTDNLAKDFGIGSIYLNQPVTKIDTSNQDKIIITTEKNGQIEAHCCDYVINTMPIGVLKSDLVEFTPSLSKEKQQAINQLEMGDFEKTFLIFDECFWQDDKGSEWLGNISEDTIKNKRTLDMMNFYKYSENFDKPMLMVLSSGSYAKALNQCTKEEKIQIIMNELKKMYPNKLIPYPREVISTNWREDPYSRGSFVAIRKGISPNLLAEMARPEANGRLIFAGEGSSKKRYATVDGAYKSGKEAAEVVVNDINAKQTQAHAGLHSLDAPKVFSVSAANQASKLKGSSMSYH
ncbi:FAD-dependent oxidoreductase [Thiotrichales bacterium 19S3-7]|nr:FAD-dependent oxidoreductase [Thiotrichales bacterium 19S3-7]MCF6802283.1 FAD-dependent oxidoreductase [Thiotrichales bacterium 19S3-11]